MESQLRLLFKNYPSKTYAVQHVVDLDLAGYKDLKPRLETKAFPNQPQKEVVCLDGTIPVFISGVQYNIPLCLWLPTNYPDAPPLAVVKPTRNMVIPPNHPIVDQNGTINIDYLRQWKRVNDLISLVQILIMEFSQKTPLYAQSQTQAAPTPAQLTRPPAPGQLPSIPQPPGYYPPSQPNPGYPPYQPPNSNYPYPASTTQYPPGTYYPPGYPTGNVPMGSTPGYPPAGSSSQSLPYPAPSYPPSTSSVPYPTANTSGMPQPYGHSQVPPYTMPPPAATTQPFSSSPAPPKQPPPSQPQSTPSSTSSTTQSSLSKAVAVGGTITEDHLKASLVDAIIDRVRRNEISRLDKLQEEVQRLMSTQDDLERGQKKLCNIQEKMEQEQRTWSTNVAKLKDRNRELADTLAALRAAGTPDADSIVVPETPLYRQLLRAYSTEQAASEAIYVLLDSLGKRNADFDATIKHVRELSRQQFRNHYLVRKCGEKAGLPST